MTLDQYLHGLSLLEPGKTENVLVRHVQNPRAEFRHPGVDLVSIMAPLKPIDVSANFDGRSTTWMLRRGDISLQPPWLEIDYKMGPIDIVAALIPLPLLSSAAGAMIPGSERNLNFRFVQQSRAPLLSSLAIELCDESRQNAPNKGFYMESLGNAFVGQIVKRYGGGDSQIFTAPQSLIQDFRVRRVLSFIDDHLADDFGLAALARQAGSSPPHLAELFKRATGETIWRYVQRRRLDRARNLLRTTSHNLGDIAEQVGYSSTPHFAVAFKAAYGMAPGKYRTANRS
jgi:AraC-like DNA-binding protein